MGKAWLAFVGPNSGTAPAKLRLAFNPAGLATGVYRDTVVVTAENAAGSPGRVPVEFMVHPCKPVPIVLNAQVTDSLTTADCGAPHRAASFARLYGFDAKANDSISVVMSSTPVDAYLVVDSSAAVTAPSLASNDACTAGHDACVRYQRLETAGTYWIEATAAGAGRTGKVTVSGAPPRAPAGRATGRRSTGIRRVLPTSARRCRCRRTPRLASPSSRATASPQLRWAARLPAGQ